MKLLIIYHSGLADDAKSIFREYVKQGIDLTVIVPVKNGSLVYSHSHDEKAFKYIPLELKLGFNIFQLFDAIKKVNPDIIHVIDEFTGFTLFQTIVCRNILYEKKVQVFSLAFQSLPLTPSFIFRSLWAFLKRVAYKLFVPCMVFYHKNNVAGVIGGNQEALQILKNLGVKIPMKLVFWGVNLDLFFPKDRMACREKFGMPQNVKLIGYFGKIIKEKGLENLVRAVSQLPEYHLLLVGHGNYKEELQAIIESLKIQDRVHWHGSVKLEELADYYNCLDVYVLPTYTTPIVKEQYGRVLVEAMACKIPIVGSTCGAIAEVLEGYPVHLIFDEYSLSDLIDKIKKIGTLRLPENFDAPAFLYKFSVKNFVTENIKFYQEISHGS